MCLRVEEMVMLKFFQRFDRFDRIHNLPECISFWDFFFGNLRKIFFDLMHLPELMFLCNHPDSHHVLQIFSTNLPQFSRKMREPPEGWKQYLGIQIDSTKYPLHPIHLPKNIFYLPRIMLHTTEYEQNYVNFHRKAAFVFKFVDIFGAFLIISTSISSSSIWKLILIHENVTRFLYVTNFFLSLRNYGNYSSFFYY